MLNKVTFKRQYLIIFLFFIFAIDRFFKILILNIFKNSDFLYKELLFFKLQFIQNTTIAFGIYLNKIFLIIIIFLILLVLIYFFSINYKNKNIFFILSLGLIILGAFSNLLDRIFYNGVIDFINIWIFPIFNIADIMIVAGVFLLLFNQKHKNDYL